MRIIQYEADYNGQISAIKYNTIVIIKQPLLFWHPLHSYKIQEMDFIYQYFKRYTKL